METLCNHINKINLDQHTTYYIVDDKAFEKTKFVNSNEKFDLKVKTNEHFTFIDNERHIMNIAGDRVKKCDWIIFNFEKFYFIEAKNIKKKNYRKDAREETYLKFNDTMTFFIYNYNFSYNPKMFAILNFRENTNDISKASLKTLKAKYRLNLKLNYEETNFLNI